MREEDAFGELAKKNRPRRFLRGQIWKTLASLSCRLVGQNEQICVGVLQFQETFGQSQWQKFLVKQFARFKKLKENLDFL